MLKLRECFGLVYGFEKFHNDVYGLPTFEAETDHRPLIAIIKKNLSDMSPRIQRLLMKLQRYDFNLSYTSGKHIVLADALSRATTQRDVYGDSSTETDVTLHVNLITISLNVSDMKSQQIAAETKRDTILQRVIKNMEDGWPKGDCQQYYSRTECCEWVAIEKRKNCHSTVPETSDVKKAARGAPRHGEM